jgi:hypothetical protein
MAKFKRCRFAFLWIGLALFIPFWLYLLYRLNEPQTTWLVDLFSK